MAESGFRKPSVRGAPMTGPSMTAVPTEETTEMAPTRMSPAETAGMPSPAVLRTGWHTHHQHEADHKHPGVHETPRNCQHYTARPAAGTGWRRGAMPRIPSGGHSGRAVQHRRDAACLVPLRDRQAHRAPP